MSKFITALIGTPQGKVASIAYALLLAIVSISVVYNNNKEQQKAFKLSGLEVFIMIILILIAFMIQIYSISCMVLGANADIGCGLWAWVNDKYVCIITGVVLITIIYIHDMV